MISKKSLGEIQYIRDRLMDLCAGDNNVDVGTLAYLLNATIKEIGGKEKIVSPKSVYFKREE
jgi:hypothetical protein